MGFPSQGLFQQPPVAPELGKGRIRSRPSLPGAMTLAFMTGRLQDDFPVIAPCVSSVWAGFGIGRDIGVVASPPDFGDLGAKGGRNSDSRCLRGRATSLPGLPCLPVPAFSRGRQGPAVNLVGCASGFSSDGTGRTYSFTIFAPCSSFDAPFLSGGIASLRPPPGVTERHMPGGRLLS